MKFTVVFDSTGESGKNLAGEVLEWIEAQEHSAVVFDAGETPLAPCLGCFACWVKTPGICIRKNDRGEEFLKAVITSDYYLRITEILWGGYSVSLKNYTDRFIPLLHPEFRIFKGEMHHKNRYKHYPQMLTIGWGAADDREEETFTRLYKANLLNFDDQGARLPLIVRGDENGRAAAWLSQVTEIGSDKEKTA